MRDPDNPYHEEDGQAMGRGIIYGVLFGVILWICILYTAYLFLK